ncbi:MAG: hypothetical protein ACFFBP_01495 [Promethearchaeota archaeon]
MNKKEKKESKKKKKIESDVYGDEFEGEEDNSESEVDKISNEDVELGDDTEEQVYS